MSRLQTVLAGLRTAGRAGLATYFTAGDPGYRDCLDLLKRLPAAGADVIELGMPFSDPLADGPVLQSANQRALRAGQTMGRTLEMVEAFRDHDGDTPLVLMGYFNPVLRYGVPRFVADAARAGVDGVILVDLPVDHADEIDRHAREHRLDVIRMSAPTTPDDRLDAILGSASGFVYHVMLAGTTGAALPPDEEIAGSLRRVTARARLPIAAGFGVRSAQQASAVGRHADLVAVGSRLVQVLAEEGADAAVEAVRRLSRAVRETAGTRE
ncbi:MAG: tryptophan synthase subunit alpha [Burkholderiaceae bacterium]